jgi:hypothetical protein
MKLKIYACILAVFGVSWSVLASAVTSGDLSPEIQRAVALAKELGDATVSGNYEKVLSFSPPEVVKMMGGKAKAISYFAQSFQSLKDGGVELTDYVVESPSLIHREKDQIFVIIPTHFSLKAPKGKRALATGYLLAISIDRGATWSFADGAGLQDPNDRAALFPNLPREVICPAIQPPKIVE